MAENQQGITGSGAWSKEARSIAPEDLERIRQAVLDLVLPEDWRSMITVARVRELARIDQRRCGKAVRSIKRGDHPDVRLPWAAPDPASVITTLRAPAAPAGGESGAAAGDDVDWPRRLADQARRAVTHDERDEVLRELAARAIEGAIKPSDADKVRQLLGELRLSGKDAREVPAEDPERIYLASEDGGRLLGVFERIVDDGRRARLLAFAAELLEEDFAELPSVDPVGRL